MKNLFRYFLYAILSFTVISCASNASGCSKSNCCNKAKTEKKACAAECSKSCCKKDQKKACAAECSKSCCKKDQKKACAAECSKSCCKK